MNTRGSSGQKRNGAGEVAADELCFLPPRCIERGFFDSPSMNTRGCLSAQKQKEGSGSRPVGPDKEEVAGANDDDYYTSDHEEATIKFSFPDRKSVTKISDEELLVIISEGIACLPSCGTTSCDCLDILSDVNVCLLESTSTNGLNCSSSTALLFLLNITKTSSISISNPSMMF